MLYATHIQEFVVVICFGCCCFLVVVLGGGYTRSASDALQQQQRVALIKSKLGQFGSAGYLSAYTPHARKAPRITNLRCIYIIRKYVWFHDHNDRKMPNSNGLL